MDLSNLKFSTEKLNDFKVIYNLNDKQIKYMNSQLSLLNSKMTAGIIQPAFVYNVEPLIVSVFCSAFDAVIMLKYPEEFVRKYDLKVGDFLVTINYYWKNKNINKLYYDPGLYCEGNYNDVYPFVMKFLIDNEQLKTLPDRPSNYYMDYIKNRADDWTVFVKNKYRDGFFYFLNGGDYNEK